RATADLAPAQAGSAAGSLRARPGHGICGSALAIARAVSANHGDFAPTTQGVIDMTQPKNPGRRTADELRAIVREKFLDMRTPGFIAEFDPEEAEYAGAFVEDALSEADALASVVDLKDSQA